MTTTRPADVSVVLCTCNGARYLEAQLRSIAGQTLRPAELIACDDASNDGTVEMLERFGRGAPFPVQVVRNPERLGSTANFDQAMGRASGRYLALADQDDVWLPHKLGTLVAVLEGDAGLGGAFCDAWLMDSRDGGLEGAPAARRTLWSVHGFGRAKQRCFASRAGAIQQLLQADVVTGATMLVRAELRELFHPIPRSWVHDGWLSWALAVRSRMQPVAEPLMHYRLHSQQQLGIGGEQTVRERIEAVRQGERARYSRSAVRFEDLLERVGAWGEDRALEEEIAAKIRLLRWRAALPHNPLARGVAIVGAAPLYGRYARGWRSMRKDLFLG